MKWGKSSRLKDQAPFNTLPNIVNLSTYCCDFGHNVNKIELT